MDRQGSKFDKVGSKGQNASAMQAGTEQWKASSRAVKKAIQLKQGLAIVATQIRTILRGLAESEVLQETMT